MDALSEHWCPVPGFEGQYEVSDFGQVRSLDRIAIYTRLDWNSGDVITVRRRHKGKILRPGKSNSGHLTVALGRGETKQIHALVLAAFVGPCPEGHECCHGDDDPANNRLANLRWGTRSDNLNDAVKNGKKPIGEQLPQAKLTASDIPSIKRECASGRGSIARAARRYGVSEATIRQVRDGRSWRHV